MAEWQSRMSEMEFRRWAQYYRQHPYDDMHRYHRPAAWVAASHNGKLEAALEWMAPELPSELFSSADLRTMKVFGIRPPKKKEG